MNFSPLATASYPAENSAPEQFHFHEPQPCPFRTGCSPHVAHSRKFQVRRSGASGQVKRSVKRSSDFHPLLDMRCNESFGPRGTCVSGSRRGEPRRCRRVGPCAAAVSCSDAARAAESPKGICAKASRRVWTVISRDSELNKYPRITINQGGHM